MMCYSYIYIYYLVGYVVPLAASDSEALVTPAGTLAERGCRVLALLQ